MGGHKMRILEHSLNGIKKVPIHYFFQNFSKFLLLFKGDKLIVMYVSILVVFQNVTLKMTIMKMVEYLYMILVLSYLLIINSYYI